MGDIVQKTRKRGGTDLCFHGSLPCIYITYTSQLSYFDIRVGFNYTNAKHKLFKISSFFPPSALRYSVSLLIHKREIRSRVVTLTLEVVTLGRAAEGDEMH